MSEVNITPTVGRIVLYCLNDTDAAAINRRRTTGDAIADRIRADRWPLGAQAHIGITACAGDVLPSIVVRVWPDGRINAQVFLDGNDTYWATNVAVSDEPTSGMFHCMPYQINQAAKAQS